MPKDNTPTHQIIMRNSEYDIIGLGQDVPEGWKDTSRKGTYSELREWINNQKKPTWDRDEKGK